jgi:hypothetical protein
MGHSKCASRPVRVHTAECGCDELSCEYSRIRDSFEIRVLTQLPNTYTGMTGPKIDHFCEEWPCPECPEDPWVILATVRKSDSTPTRFVASIPATKLSITYEHRRQVRTYAEWYYLCLRNEDKPIEIIKTRPISLIVDEGASESSATIGIGGRLRTIDLGIRLEEGDNFERLLERVGNMEIVDTLSNDTISLREAYAIAGVDPAEPIKTVDEAIAPLEGLDLRINDYRTIRSSMEKLLDKDGVSRLEVEHSGSPTGAGNLPATAIDGVSSRSHLGKFVANMTVAEVASSSKEEFIEGVLEGVEENRKKATERQAREVWARSKRIANLAAAWSGGR